MAAPKEILDLIERFERNIDAYKTGQYNETQLRREFLDPFFKQLGWDIDNTAGYAEPYKDVIHEDQIRLAGAAKAPDYSFRIGGARKFFLEAKKPSIYIKGDPSPAFQLRRYAWTEKLPLSILSDFEEFAVYDGRFKPINGDDASKARIFYCTFKEYPEKWDWIASIFSRDAILKGSFDKYAEANKSKRGTTDVDEDFLATIESWRKELAQNLALRNPALSQRELNFAVQRIIDRIIFLRICEDRAIEDYGRLRALTNGDRIYPRLCQLFEEADVRYNSGLFHFHKEKDRHEAPDELTLNLEIDDKLLRDILKPLYYPDCPYAFSHFPADILGQVYEQFLGKVIELTEGHRAKVVDKPEVKKAGGVYYTPTYIVKYIVEQTVGKLLENKTPKQAAALRILDPACGSGSFLIGAYQHLLDWHLNWYTQNDPVKFAKGSKPALVQAAGGAWKLTIDERKRILLNNIYGVDIDSQAVETTKLSLLLKVLEGETNQSLQPVLKIFHERALPDLGDNIKCGNSLIAPDFYQQPDLQVLTEEDRYRINVFQFAGPHGFPKIVAAGGFDALLGNPPWGATFTESELDYLRTHYPRVIQRMVDSYIYFIDRAIQLARPSAPIGFIIPSTMLNQVDAQPVRELLLHRRLAAVLNMGQGIFGKKVLNTSTIFISTPDNRGLIAVENLSAVPFIERSQRLRQIACCEWEAWREQVVADPHRTFFTGSIASTALLQSLSRRFPPLEQFVDGEIQRGVTPDVTPAHVIDRAYATAHQIETAILRPSITGSQIKRYRPWVSDQYVLYVTPRTAIQNYPNAWNHISQFAEENTCPEVKQKKHPVWSLHRARNPEIFDSPKFIGVTTSKRIELAFDERSNLVVTDAMYVFRLHQGINPFCALAVLQSKAFLFLYRVSNQGESRVIPQVKASKLGVLPVPFARTFDDDRLRGMVQNVMALNVQLTSLRTPQEKSVCERQIAATDAQIDRLVYELYGLTEDEIKIVEQATA